MKVVMATEYPVNPEKISGGVEAVALYLTQAMQKYSNIDLNVVTLDSHRLGDRMEVHGRVKVFCLKPSGMPSRLSIADNKRRIKNKIAALSPDIVHVQVAGLYALAAAETGLPWVLTLHGISFMEAELWESYFSRVYRGWFIKKDEFRAVSKASNFISISPFIREVFGRHLKGNIFNIENPVSASYFKIRRRTIRGRLLFVGRLIYRKGLHTLLKAFYELRKELPETTLRIVGEGISSNDSIQYLQGIKKYVREKELERFVFFLGELGENDLSDEYSKCAAFVLPSVLETAPIVILEAMASGVPVVASDVGGVRYIVEHGKTGLVVPSGNATALCGALHSVLTDDGKNKKMGEIGKKYAITRYGSEVVAEKTVKVYNELI